VEEQWEGLEDSGILVEDRLVDQEPHFLHLLQLAEPMISCFDLRAVRKSYPCWCFFSKR
jgi:hypothetical protein